jgi:hypothetical protein
MSFVAVAIGASAVIGAGASIYSAKVQAKAAQKGADAANATTRYMYDQNRQDLAPYRETGANALSVIADMYGLPRAAGGGFGISDQEALTAAGQVPGSNRLSLKEQLFNPAIAANPMQHWKNVAAIGAGPIGLGLLRGGSDHSPPNPLTSVDFSKIDISGVPMPTNDGYWRDKTPEEWKAYLEGIAKDPAGHVIDGAPRINAHLRDYLAKNLGKYAKPIAPAPGSPGAVAADWRNRPVDRTGGFQASPGYQFRLNEGNRAIETGAAARGRLFSGSTVKRAADYSQGLASDEFERFRAALFGIAGLGGTAASQTATLGANAGARIADTQYQSSLARGSAYAAGADGVNNAVQGGLGNWLFAKQAGLLGG